VQCARLPLVEEGALRPSRDHREQQQKDWRKAREELLLWNISNGGISLLISLWNVGGR
jgi:hypothetical protein